MKSPSILLITNMASQHQLEFGRAMHNVSGGRFRLAIHGQLSVDRRQLGWKEDDFTGDSFMLCAHAGETAVREIQSCLDEYDVVVLGDGPSSMIRSRVKQGKLTFRYTERIWKKGRWRIVSPRILFGLYRDLISLDRPNYHLLAAGAYCPWDMSQLGVFKNRMWTWGYFVGASPDPPVNRENGVCTLYWAGRMLRWKEVPLLVHAVTPLVQDGLKVRLVLRGDGPDRPRIERTIRHCGIGDSVDILAPLPPLAIRSEMNQADIFVLASNREEGWGVVINEAMNAGCCVVASDGAGAVPWLIRDGENGLIYSSGDRVGLTRLLRRVVIDWEERRRLGQRAWSVMRDVWSAEVAARRFVNLSSGLLRGGPPPEYDSGPCSRAPIVRPPHWV